MKRFQFNLRSVATVRALREMKAREGLITAIRECEALRHAHDERKESVVRFSDGMRAPGVSGIRGETQAALLRAFSAEIAAEAAAGGALASAVQSREACRTRWIDAHLRCKQMDDLRARARVRHEADNLRIEQGQLDDRLVRHSNLSPA